MSDVAIAPLAGPRIEKEKDANLAGDRCGVPPSTDLSGRPGGAPCIDLAARCLTPNIQWQVA